MKKIIIAFIVLIIGVLLIIISIILFQVVRLIIDYNNKEKTKFTVEDIYKYGEEKIKEEIR